jgi:hypothetical protein
LYSFARGARSAKKKIEEKKIKIKLLIIIKRKENGREDKYIKDKSDESGK